MHAAISKPYWDAQTASRGNLHSSPALDSGTMSRIERAILMAMSDPWPEIEIASDTSHVFHSPWDAHVASESGGKSDTRLQRSFWYALHVINFVLSLEMIQSVD